MNQTDERIRAAAEELSAALTAGGKDYWVTAHDTDVTKIESEVRQRVWTIHVAENSQRDIAP